PQGTPPPPAPELGLGARAAAVERIVSQGDFRQTGNNLDLVVEGDGFFQIQLPDGQIGYTRDGTFKPDNQGRLVNSDGFALIPEITIPPEANGKVTVGQDGTVSATLPGAAEPQQL